MALGFHRLASGLSQALRKKPKAAPNPALTLAGHYTGKYAFLDELTNKSHQLSVSPELDIQIDGRSLPGQVTGITTAKLTFLDHYGYELIITNGAHGPESVYDEAEDATYAIFNPNVPRPADDEDNPDERG
ncbi:DUF4828 domain-containing protein [Lacticaseibacillus yichunensis]|uniref:DUF4828 domain-containing protein n=1 Tax=Lacticaseibacillus yichunensis TaxID=2486015 RepID=A0ABW4CKU8_9LACO|nr:DUF4828 domain-containing protein [Lacticaseibacillus yichunensis]